VIFAQKKKEKRPLVCLRFIVKHILKVEGAEITGLNCVLNVLSSTHRLHLLSCGCKVSVLTEKKKHIPPSSSFLLLVSL